MIDDVHGWLQTGSDPLHRRDAHIARAEARGLTPSPRTSCHILPAVGIEAGAGDEAGGVVGEEGDTARDLLGGAETADRDERQDLGVQNLLRHRHHHLGGDVAGRDDVDGDAARGRLLGHRLGEAEQGRLGGGVVGLARLTLAPVDGGDVDDAPEAARAHPLDHEPRHVEDGVEVGVDHRVPVLLRHTVEHAVAGDAGVVDENVDGPEIARDARHPLLAGGIVAHVELVDGDARLGLELARGGIVAGVGGGYTAALVLEGNGDGVADAARTSGDDPWNPCHLASSH